MIKPDKKDYDLNDVFAACRYANEMARYADHLEFKLAPNFGDFVQIEMKRHGVPNEMYSHKVIQRLKSNVWVDVPVQSPAMEARHEEMENVVRCICCGVQETEVLRYRIKDVNKL